VANDLSPVIDAEGVRERRTRDVDRGDLTVRQQESMFPGTV